MATVLIFLTFAVVTQITSFGNTRKPQEVTQKKGSNSCSNFEKLLSRAVFQEKNEPISTGKLTEIKCLDLNYLEIFSLKRLQYCTDLLIF